MDWAQYEYGPANEPDTAEPQIDYGLDVDEGWTAESNDPALIDPVGNCELSCGLGL